MKIQSYKGFLIDTPDGTGKAVRGNKITSTIRVLDRQGMRMIIRYQTRYKVHDMESKSNAVVRAVIWIDKYLETKNENNAQKRSK